MADARRRRVLLAALLCGLAFLAVFGVMIFMVDRDLTREGEPFVRRQLTLSLITIAGLFATNFLSVLLAMLLPVDTLSGEIDSGVMQTLASKPIARWQILLGKWLAHSTIASAYLLFVACGVLLAGRLAAGHHQVDQGGGEPDAPDDLVVAGAEDRRETRRRRGRSRGL